MSYSTDLGAIKTATDAAVTTKVTPSSISPADVGSNIENLITLLQTGDIDKIISLGNIVNNQAIIMKNGGGVIGIQINPAVAGKATIYLLDSTTAFYSWIA